MSNPGCKTCGGGGGIGRAMICVRCGHTRTRPGMIMCDKCTLIWKK